MVFEFKITVPANTPESNKYRYDVRLAYGIIHQIDIDFPPGCVGMVKLVICDGLFQVFPSNPGGYFSGTHPPISGKVFYELNNEPFELQIYAWSPGTEYDHTVTVRFWILKPWQLFALSEQMWRLRGL